MAITLVEVYEVIAAVARQVQESEAKAQGLAQQVQSLEETVCALTNTLRKVESERDGYKEHLMAVLRG